MLQEPPTYDSLYDSDADQSGEMTAALRNDSESGVLEDEKDDAGPEVDGEWGECLRVFSLFRSNSLLML
jgi:hypothetical protein